MSHCRSQENEFIKVILNKINILRPKVLIPTHDESVIIAKHINDFPKWLSIPIADYDTQINLSNKIYSTNIANKIGIPIPKIYNTINEAIFPCVIKCAYGNSSKAVFFSNNKVSASKILSNYNHNEILIQEKISGIDYSVDCINYNNFFYATVYKSIVTKTLGGGTSTQRIIVDYPILITYAKKILEYCNYNGVCGIDFKVNENTGKHAFIEINTRYTGGLATPICAGFDIPFIHYNLALKNPITNNLCVKLGTKTKWILGDIITLVSRCVNFNLSLTEFRRIINFKFDAFDDFNTDDKSAIFGEMLYYFVKLIKNRKLNP